MFVDPDAPLPPAPMDRRLTLGDVCDEYKKAHVQVPTRRERAQKAMEWNLKLIRRTEIPAGQGTTIRFEEKPIEDITRADVEAFRTTRRALLVDARSTLDQIAKLETQAREIKQADRKAARVLRREARALRRATKAAPA